MKIREFSVFRYGPLANRGRIDLENFNLLFGQNEEGKTLTIDALVKLLMGKGSRSFDRINRVEEQPEGYVMVEKEDLGEIKLPQAGNLTAIAGLTASECRNIFIIRDSDLAIAKEDDFYRDVTNRLVGLQTEEIARIISELRHLGSLTLKGDFQDTSPRKLKTRLQQAAVLTDQIDNQLQLLEEAGFEELEEELWEVEQKLDELEDELERHEEARQGDKFSTGREALDVLQDSLEALKELSVFNRDDEQRWQERETKLRNYKADQGRQAANLEEEIKKLERCHKSKEAEEFLVQGFNRSRDRLEEDLKPKIAAYRSLEHQFMREKSRGWGNFLSVFGPLSILCFLLSIAGMFLWEQGGEWFSAAVILALAAVLIYGGFLLRIGGEKRRLADLMKKIVTGAEELKFKAGTPAGILEKINEFALVGEEKNRKIQELDRDIALCNQRIESINKELEELAAGAREAEDEIRKIRESTGVDTFQEYRVKLKSREEYEQEVKTRAGILTGQFGAEADDLNANISFWEEKIAALHDYARPVEGLGYDGGEIEPVREKRSRLRNRKQELGYELERYRKEMDVLGREINACLAPENEYVPCQMMKDLPIAREKLQEFISVYHGRSAYTHAAINILEQIGAEEEKKVQDLFGPGSAVSKYFARITDNLYTEVSLNREKGMVEVLRSDGRKLDAWQLSGGAYDQLYLCIRISLGEKLLQGEKGFFILDDPFLKSDTRRLMNQIEFLRDLAGHGWQIIFFTAKDEVKTVLAEAIDQGEVNLVMM